MTKAKNTKISRSEYYQIVGLLGLAHEYGNKQDDMAEYIAGILGVEDEANHYFGIVSDAVFDQKTEAKQLLKALGIKVV